MNLIAYDLFHLGKKLTSSHVRNKNEEILVFSAGSFCLLLTSFFWFLLYCTRNACLIFGSVGCIFELWTFWFLCTGHKYFYNTRTHVTKSLYRIQNYSDKQVDVSDIIVVVKFFSVKKTNKIWGKSFISKELKQLYIIKTQNPRVVSSAQKLKTQSD